MNYKLKGGLFVFFGAASFGILSTIVKTANGLGYTVGHITGSQSMFGFLILWAVYLIQKFFFNLPPVLNNSKGERPKKVTPWWLVSIAGSATGMVGVFYYQAVTLLPASIAIILLMQYLWISIIIEWAVFKKRPSQRQIIAAAIVLLGTVFAGGVFKDSLDLNPTGLFYGFLAAVMYSIFLMTSGRVGNEYPPFKKSALMITGAMTITWLIYPPTFLFDGLLLEGLYKWGLLLALLGTVIPPLFFSIGVPKVGVSVGAILSAAELPVAVVASRFILKESVDGLQWFGVALILAAIILSNLRVKTRDELLNSQ